jgi:hypothetical protein
MISNAVTSPENFAVDIFVRSVLRKKLPPSVPPELLSRLEPAL